MRSVAAAHDPARFLGGASTMTEAPVHVRDWMSTEVITLSVDEHLNFASDLMRLARIRHMPVLSKGRVVGIVSQRDLFRAAISSALGLPRAAEREWLEKIRVAEVMTKRVVTAASEWPIRQAVDVMLEHKVGCLPVVDDGQLVGLLSETDCLHLLARLLAPATDAPRTVSSG
jgi:acetoin utilization protein AcuB